MRATTRTSLGTFIQILRRSELLRTAQFVRRAFGSVLGTRYARMQNRIACDTCPPFTFRTRHEAVLIGKAILTVVTTRHAAALKTAVIEAGLQGKVVISVVLRLAVV